MNNSRPNPVLTII